MPSDDQDFGQGFRLAAIALVCAVVTATAVIGIGQAWLARAPQTLQDTATPQVVRLVPTSG